MIPGEGAFTIMEDGTGGLGSVGIGFPTESGVLAGSTGIADIIILDGVL